MLLAEVVFPLPVNRAFDYRVPPGLAGVLREGHRVRAPFGHRGLQLGLVTRLREAEEAGAPGVLKDLAGLVDADPALGPEDLALARWMSSRYFCSPGEAAFGVLPVGKQLPPREAANGEGRNPAGEEPAGVRDSEFTPTEDQRTACEKILPALRERRFRPFLLQGPAASGKTEVYMRLIAEALGLGRSALFLVPEIGLTPQVEGLLRARFGGAVEVWHSGLPRGERWRVWRRARAGLCRVALGPRSALFLPVRDPGVIVVDEEHDASYKSDSTPRYHARETALEKGRLHGAVVVLGSATPSMETWKRTLDGALELASLDRRVGDRPFPSVRVVDMRKEGGWYMSDALVQAVADRLSRSEQSLLFLNRRGYATYITCRGCGWEARCPNCAVSLVHHKPEGDRAEGLRCHYCFHSRPPAEKCPQCGQSAVKWKGRGTQRVCADLQTLFPQARLLRWDRDTTQGRRSHERAFEAVKSASVDIVVGTQMVSQGLDFPRLTLAAVLDADQALRMPDFRAGERTFQLLAQVAGRAGRGETPGEVILQTRHPEHYALQSARGFDHRAFAAEELRYREEMAYPPYVRLALNVLRAKTEAAAESAADHLMQWLEGRQFPPEVRLLGPAPSFHLLRAGFAHWQVIVKAPEPLWPAVLDALRSYAPPKSVSWAVDVDPQELA